MALRTLMALFKGEVSLQRLEEYRQRGSAIYDLLNKQSSLGLWQQSPNQAVERLCAWNAFALHMFAEQVIKAEARLEPYTAGFTAQPVHNLLRRYYQSSIQWSQLMQKAQQDPDFLPGSKLPASLPAWTGASQYSLQQLKVLLEATQALQTQVERRIEEFLEIPQPFGSRVVVLIFPENHPQMVRVLQRKLKNAESKLHSSHTQISLAKHHSKLWLELRLAAGEYFSLGQLMAMPSLIATKPR